MHRDLQRQRHVVVVMRARRDVDVDADVLVVERGDRLLRRAAGGDRREGRDRDRHLLAEARLRRRCLRRCAAAGSQACACSCRSSAAGSRAPAGPANRMSACVRLRSACSVSVPVVVGRDRHAAVDARSTPGDAICSPYSCSRVRSTSSSSTSMITSGRALSIAESTRAAAAMRSGVSLIVSALVRGRRRDAPRVEHQAQQVHRLLEIGVAQVERADDFFFVLAALGRRVGNDEDGLRRGDAEERARRAGDGAQRVLERGVAQVDA